jgi:hypothetical protein
LKVGSWQKAVGKKRQKSKEQFAKENLSWQFAKKQLAKN